MAREDVFVSTEWLAERLNAPDIVVVDASWYLPAQKRDGAAEYAARRIPGAVHFDIDKIKDTRSSLPHMLPSAPEFAAAVGALGIGDGMRIVVYDGLGFFSAPRVRWTFKVFGARDVVILDGGFPKWLAEGRPVEEDRPQPAPAPRLHRPARQRRRRRCGGRGARDGLASDPGGRRARCRSLPRRGGGAPARPAVRPYSRLAQPAVFPAAHHRWQAEGAGRDRQAVPGCRRRSRQALDHDLRLGRLGRDPVDGARDHRQAGQGNL